MKRISVCMATYNGEKYISEQLKSILEQIGDNDEGIVSDDSSTDDTLSIVKSFNDPRIRIFPDQKFRGPLGNFQNALSHAEGRFIFLADQDDVWVPFRVEKLLPYFSDFDLLVNDCKIVNDKLEVIHQSYFKLMDAHQGLIRNLLRPSSYIGCCMCFTRELLMSAMPFPHGIPMHDYWIAMLAEAKFRIKFVDEQLLLYRRHGGNISFTAEGSKNSIVKKIGFRINTIVPLISRLWLTK